MPDGTTQRPRPFRIGITGPIGCGKSTVAGWLAEAPGVVVIDADQVARDVLDRDEPALDAVVRRFGTDLMLADGSLDRAALGRIVFSDPAALRDLEAIVHPAVRPRILAAIAVADEGNADVVVIEAIKLVEGGLAELCDEVWLVTCDPDVQRDRIVGRGSTEDDARAADRGPGRDHGAAPPGGDTDDRHVLGSGDDPGAGEAALAEVLGRHPA